MWRNSRNNILSHFPGNPQEDLFFWNWKPFGGKQAKLKSQGFQPHLGKKALQWVAKPVFLYPDAGDGDGSFHVPPLFSPLIAQEGRDEESSKRQHFSLLQWWSWKDPSHCFILSHINLSQKQKEGRDPDGLSGGGPNCRQGWGQGTSDTHNYEEDRHKRLGRWAPPNKQ